MRSYVASPVVRLRDMPRAVIVTYFALCAIWLVGIIVAGGFGQSDGVDGAGAAGAVVGALTNMPIGLLGRCRDCAAETISQERAFGVNRGSGCSPPTCRP